ncbi:hypothetical protein [Parerythrobacter aestuarii]|uniref:hypothetical protein n=1 Tax=Parerythrobacter aestuarii TaxID=3020909 RepID=UPI0024DE93D1|nr:hypothetical protein [Parerythrobacter aestuarii]
MTHLKTVALASATLSMLATPVAAADLPVSSQRSDYAQTGYDTAQDTAERHRRWRHRNRVDAGDVIAGIAILGGIAAIASAASNNKRRDRYDDRRYQDRRYQDRQYRDDNPRRYQSSNLDRAVSTCTSAIERDVRVDSVDSVSRSGEGWQVSGRLYDGNGFTCSVSGDGRIDRIDYAGSFSGASNDYSGAEKADDKQWADDDYSRARQAQAGQDAPLVAPEGPRPSYPGGPLPGEEIDGDLGG